MEQVICLRDDWGEFPKGYETNRLPQKGSIYTVHMRLGPGEAINFQKRAGVIVEMIALEEIYFTKRPSRPCFNAMYFRPVKPTSIDVFHEILNKINTGAGHPPSE